jgi:hypothetical protein
VLVAARRTLSRTVVEQWQRASRGGAERGWVVDAILLTATVAGLIELRVSGQIGSARQGALGLLVPGLLGVAVAVVASRLLVVACRAGFGVTRRRGWIGPFLALRHVARRPGGMRTTIVLATAFALAGFAVATWSVALTNVRSVADARVGAAAVLTVTPPNGTSLARIVDRIDPGGGRPWPSTSTPACPAAPPGRFCWAWTRSDSSGSRPGSRSGPASRLPRSPRR